MTGMESSGTTFYRLQTEPTGPQPSPNQRNRTGLASHRLISNSCRSLPGDGSHHTFPYSHDFTRFWDVLVINSHTGSQEDRV